MENSKKVKIYKGTQKLTIDVKDLDYYLKCGWKQLDSNLKEIPTLNKIT